MKEILMSKNRFQCHWYLLALIILCLIGVIVYPSIVFSEILYISGCYLGINAVVFIIGFGILHKLKMLYSWRFAAYLSIVLAGSFFINVLLYRFMSDGFYVETMLYDISGRDFLGVLITFMGLSLLNFVILKILFALSFWQSCSMAIVMGLVGAIIGFLVDFVPITRFIIN